MNWKALTTGPAVLALLLTLGNAAKPPVVDDTAYLLFARHLAAHPLDPYSWELHWYARPEPAMDILLPPVLPYWLALGIRVFGEQPTLLKLWLFPVCWLFTRSAWALFARFAPGWERPGTVLTTLGPACLPLVNFMLDVPAAAFGLAALVAFVRGCNERSTRRILLAGLLAGLAMQTKYTTLTLPGVFAAYALTRRQLLPALGAVAVAGGVFALWEVAVTLRHAESHFLHQLGLQPGGDWRTRLDAKLDLFRPLVAQLGGLAVAWGLLVGWAVGVNRWALAGVAGLVAVGYVAVAVTPAADTVLLRSGDTGTPRLDLPTLVYLGAGYGVLASAVAVCVRLRRSADGWFLIGWLAVEVVGYFALTPFPASRRVVPLVLALGFAVARAAPQKPPAWVIAFGVACGLALLALDTWDARVEPAGVEAAAAIIGDLGPRAVWTQGHWGWQYAADRRGWQPLHPDSPVLGPGIFVVLPVEPDMTGFYRPYHGGLKAHFRPDSLELVGEWVWQDRLAAQTVPNLYGGVFPVVGRDHPRLRVQVYRVVGQYALPTFGTP